MGATRLVAYSLTVPLAFFAGNKCWPGLRSRRLPTRHNSGMVAINLGFLVLGFAVGSSSLTFSWVLEHQAAVNYFPEFAGRVVYLSDILVIAGIFIWLSADARQRSEASARQSS